MAATVEFYERGFAHEPSGASRDEEHLTEPVLDLASAEPLAAGMETSSRAPDPDKG